MEHQERYPDHLNVLPQKDQMTGGYRAERATSVELRHTSCIYFAQPFVGRPHPRRGPPLYVIIGTLPKGPRVVR